MLGYILTNNTRGEAGQVLQDITQQLAAQGIRLAGAVQINTDNAADCTCDMDLQILGDDGPVIRISQALGAQSQACRLDAGALELAVARVEAVLAGGVDFLILNKFAKQESFGKGFRDIIATALEQDIPVLTCVSEDYLSEFNAFAGDLAQPLEFQQAADWCRTALQGKAA